MKLRLARYLGANYKQAATQTNEGFTYVGRLYRWLYGQANREARYPENTEVVFTADRSRCFGFGSWLRGRSNYSSNILNQSKRAMWARTAWAVIIWIAGASSSLAAKDSLDKFQIVGSYDHFGTIKTIRADECRINFQQQSSISEPSYSSATRQAVVHKSTEGRINAFYHWIVRCRFPIEFLNPLKKPSAREGNYFFDIAVLSWEKNLSRQQITDVHVSNLESGVCRFVSGLSNIGMDFKIKIDVYCRGSSNILESTLDRDFDYIGSNFQWPDNFHVKFNPRSICEDHRAFGNISGSCSCLCAVLSYFYRGLHIAGLRSGGIFSCLPKTFGGNPEKNGRERQYDSESGNQFVFVSTQEVRERSQSDINDGAKRADKKGAVILFTAVIGCLLIIWLACRKP